ncbi:MAG: carboxypeptidase-like regulatory domain-containing protein [Terriglobia bacterium]
MMKRNRGGRTRVASLARCWLRGRHGRKRINAWWASVFVLLLLGLTPRSSAKQKPPVTKTVSGVVLDSSGESVSGASVLLTDIETSRTDAIYSGANGRYMFTGLNLTDDYRIQAKYQGRASNVHDISSFDTRVNRVINLVLNPPLKAPAPPQKP